jgi:hypothetical protein
MFLHTSQAQLTKYIKESESKMFWKNAVQKNEWQILHPFQKSYGFWDS